MPKRRLQKLASRLPSSLSSLLLVCLGCQPTADDSPASTETTSTEDTSTQTHGVETSTTETSSSESGSSESGELPSIDVQWIEVAASDYKLELDPEFDSELTSYTALADGPDIAVYVDVIVNADVEGVLVNEVPALPYGFRTWRSLDTELISPTTVTIEVLAEPVELPIYTVEITVP